MPPVRKKPAAAVLKRPSCDAALPVDDVDVGPVSKLRRSGSGLSTSSKRGKAAATPETPSVTPHASSSDCSSSSESLTSSTSSTSDNADPQSPLGSPPPGPAAPAHVSLDDSDCELEPFAVPDVLPGHDPDLPTVKSLKDVFNWFNDMIHRFGGRDFANSLFDQLDGITMTSAFSGIGSADVAMHMLHQDLLGETGKSFRYRNVYAIEWEPQCQYELRLLPKPPEHLYSDINGFLNPKVSEAVLDNVRRWTWPQLTKMVKKRNFVSSTATCMQCSTGTRLCSCAIGKSDLHIAGSPCVDFSSFKNNPKFMAGDNVLCLMTWVGMRLRMQDRCVLHEITPNFDHGVFEELMSHMYTKRIDPVL